MIGCNVVKCVVAEGLCCCSAGGGEVGAMVVVVVIDSVRTAKDDYIRSVFLSRSEDNARDIDRSPATKFTP